MKYILNNTKCLNDKNLHRKVKQVVKKQMNRLSRLTDNYRKPVTVNIFFNQIDNVTYQISAVVVLKQHVIYLKEKETDIETGIYKLFDRLKLSLTRKIQKEKKDYLFRRKKNRLKNLHENIKNLQDLRQETTKETFKKFLEILLHDVSHYIERRIKTTEAVTELNKGSVKVEELLDELFLIVYDEFEEIPVEKEKITVWLYQKADELLDERLNDYQFNRDKLVRIETILEKELEAFDEQFTIDADEEIIPVEELDELIPKTDEHSIYELLFSEDEESLLEEITLKLNQDKIQKIIHLELAKLPVNERSILDLYLIDQLSEEEIAEIKNMAVNEIQDIINKNTNQIKQSLSKAL